MLEPAGLAGAARGWASWSRGQDPAGDCSATTTLMSLLSPEIPGLGGAVSVPQGGPGLDQHGGVGTPLGLPGA